MQHIFYIIKILSFIAFILMSLLLGIDSVSNFEVVYGYKTLLSLLGVIIVSQFLQEMFIPESTWDSLRRMTNRKDSKVELSLFGFKWNSVFNH